VRVRPGAAPVTLRLRPAGELSGKIMDARGKPVSGFIRTCSLTQGSCEEKRSRPSGRFNLEGLPPDRYDVIAWTDGGAVGALRNVRVDAGRVVEGLRIQVDPGAVLELEAAEPLLDLRVLDAAGRKVCDFTSLMAGTRFSCVVEPGVWLAQRCDEEVVLQEVKVTLRTGERRKIVLGAP
jgi:hypothetical protein